MPLFTPLEESDESLLQPLFQGGRMITPRGYGVLIKYCGHVFPGFRAEKLRAPLDCCLGKKEFEHPGHLCGSTSASRRAWFLLGLIFCAIVSAWSFFSLSLGNVSLTTVGVWCVPSSGFWCSDVLSLSSSGMLPSGMM